MREGLVRRTFEHLQTLPTVSELPPRRFRRRRVCATALRSLRSTVELSAQRGSRPLANAIRSPIRLTAWRPANTASLLSSVACFEHVPAEAVWRGCRSKESSTRAHRRYASVKFQRPLRWSHTFDTRGEGMYRGGWLDLQGHALARLSVLSRSAASWPR